MGITGLWPILEPCCQPVTLESMEGKKLAVDVSIWIYQAQLAFPAESRSPHLALMLSRMAKLLFYKIRPVFVFDGRDVPIFKQKVLEDRRLKKYEEDVLLNKGKRKHLENLARGCENEEEARRGLVDGLKKRQRQGDEALFDLPAVSAPEITISDGEEDLVVEKVVEKTVMTKTEEIQRLMDLKEQIRVSRLHPDAIPKKTDEFCQFQLARVLGRNKINRTIVKLTQEQQNRFQKADVRLAVADSQGGTHVISYDNYEDCQIVNSEPSTSRLPDNWESLGLTLEHFQQLSDTSLESRLEDEEDTFDYTDFAAEMAGRDFVGKGTMIENFMKRRIGSSKAAALRQDDWSSDSGDEDFIDVSDGEINLDGKIDEDLAEIIENQPNAPSTSRVAAKRRPFVPQKTTDDRDSGAYRDLQEFLTACGFPWIEAPGEAEAQCVELERLGLVEGVVSDDSDIWAFGAQNAYRHLFSKDRNVQHYNQKKIFKETGLSQSNIVEIAMISGGDYSQGIHGVGVVTAIELLAEFGVKMGPGEERNEIIASLAAVEDWLFAKGAEPNAIRRKIKALVEKNNEMEHLHGICNPAVVDSYLRPNVDSANEQLRWKSVNVDRLRAVVEDKLGWPEDKFNKLALTAFQKWNDFITGAASYQKHITSYALVQSAEEQRTTMTKRVAEALARLAKKTNPDPPTLICQATFEDQASVRRARPLRKPTTKKTMRKGAKKPPAPL